MVLVTIVIVFMTLVTLSPSGGRQLRRNVPIPSFTHINGKRIQPTALRKAQSSEYPTLDDIVPSATASATPSPTMRLQGKTALDQTLGALGGEETTNELTERERSAVMEVKPHVGLILPFSISSLGARDALKAFDAWEKRQDVDGTGLEARLYIHVKDKDMWAWEDEIGDRFRTYVRSCTVDPAAVDDDVTRINCLANFAIKEGAQYVCMIDDAEFTQPEVPDRQGKNWLVKAVADLLHLDFDHRFYVSEVRHLGVAGRGAQWRSRLDTETPYVKEYFGAEIAEARRSGTVPIIQQFKALNQFSKSLCVHRQHVEIFGGILHPTLSLNDGILWLAGIYSFGMDTLIIDFCTDWPLTIIGR